MTLFSILLCVLSVPVWPAGREAEMNGFYRFRADVSSGTATGGFQGVMDGKLLISLGLQTPSSPVSRHTAGLASRALIAMSIFGR